MLVAKKYTYLAHKSEVFRILDGHFHGCRLYSQVFEVVLGIAFSWDFTTRVKAVASGLLFGGSSNDIEKEVPQFCPGMFDDFFALFV